MRRLLTSLVPLFFGLVLASPAQAAFGIQEFNLNFVSESGGGPAAGSHPAAVVTNLKFNTEPDPIIGERPIGAPRNLEFHLPLGLVGKPTAVPRCAEPDFVAIEGEPPVSRCPAGTQVGVVVVRARIEKPIPGGTPLYFTAPVFNLTPSPGAVQKIGFWVSRLVPVVINFSVSQDAPYRVIAKIDDISQTAPLYGSKLFLWGNPASHSHDGERMSCIHTFEGINQERINTTKGCKIPANVPEGAYVTMPTNCTSPLLTEYFATSWTGELDVGFSTSEPLAGCESNGFAPSISSDPTSHAQQSSSGLNFSLDVEDEGLVNPNGVAQSDIKRTEVVLPEGMTVNPSLGEGLAACSIGDLSRETLSAAPGEGCPQASKIGSVEVETPLLEERLNGSLYAATPFDNEAGSLLAVYLVIKNPNLGVNIKQTIKVLPDEKTGRLTAIADDIPQFPFSHFRLKFRGGERGPLTTPADCANYDVKAVMTPWSGGPAVTSVGKFQISTGPAPGGSCGASPFAPSFEAGTLAPIAGSHSPFVLNVSRAAGSPRLSSIETTLPEGLLGKLAGLTECSEGAIGAARARSGPNQGGLEIASASCPKSSEVGTVRAGAGSGAQTYVQGHAYLAGPYRGAPLSLVVITPAVVGPFDLGSVVVRAALYVNPITAQVRAVSDPFPSILQGIPIELRSISIDLSRPEFTLNPTSCEPMQVLGQATSLIGQTAPLASRFQVGGCNGLDFAPKLSLQFKGGTKRSKNPALKAVLTQPQGEANIKQVSVVLPKSAFIDNRHINNPCTRVQFNEDKCPPKSILGHATAYSPLLAKPLSGPVYFRSNGGERELPDLVAALRGQIDVNVLGFIDSVKIKGSEVRPVRTRFQTVPDAPVSRFVLQMKGGKLGLLQNSENLCKGKRHAKIKMVAHNGKTHDFNPVVQVKCGGKKKAK